MKASLSTSLHAKLLALHKALIGWQRREFERTHGRQSDVAFLEAMTKDPELGWINALTTLIVGAEEGEVAAVGATLRKLLVADRTGDLFQQRYSIALQESPDVVMAHAELMRALPALPQGERKP